MFQQRRKSHAYLYSSPWWLVSGSEALLRLYGARKEGSRGSKIESCDKKRSTEQHRGRHLNEDDGFVYVGAELIYVVLDWVKTSFRE
jgi:hypothetical protein